MHVLSEHSGVHMYYLYYYYYYFFPYLTRPVPVTNQGPTLCLVHQLARIDMDAR